MSVGWMGWQRHLHLRKEDAWGVRSLAQPDLYVPCRDYTVAIESEAVVSDLFTGLRQRRHSRRQRARVVGSLVVPLLGYHVSGRSVAEHLLRWATSGPTSPFVDSYSADVFEDDTDNKRHLGLRVRTMRLQGDAVTGSIPLTLELEGKEEVGGITPPALNANVPPPVEFAFDDVELYLSEELDAASASGSVDAWPIRSFDLRLDNNLKVYHTNSFFPTCVAGGVRAATLKFSLFKEDNTFDVLRRLSTVGQFACRLVLRGPHLGTVGTGTQTEIEIKFDRVSFVNAIDRIRLQELASQEVDWIVLKPVSTDDDVDIVYRVV
jgi:hypothetical protein